MPTLKKVQKELKKSTGYYLNAKNYRVLLGDIGFFDSSFIYQHSDTVLQPNQISKRTGSSSYNNFFQYGMIVGVNLNAEINAKVAGTNIGNTNMAADVDFSKNEAFYSFFVKPKISFAASKSALIKTVIQNWFRKGHRKLPKNNIIVTEFSNTSEWTTKIISGRGFSGGGSIKGNISDFLDPTGTISITAKKKIGLRSRFNSTGVFGGVKHKTRVHTPLINGVSIKAQLPRGGNPNIIISIFDRIGARKPIMDDVLVSLLESSTLFEIEDFCLTFFDQFNLPDEFDYINDEMRLEEDIDRKSFKLGEFRVDGIAVLELHAKDIEIEDDPDTSPTTPIDNEVDVNPLLQSIFRSGGQVSVAGFSGVNTREVSVDSSSGRTGKINHPPQNRKLLRGESEE